MKTLKQYSLKRSGTLKDAKSLSVDLHKVNNLMVPNQDPTDQNQSSSDANASIMEESPSKMMAQVKESMKDLKLDLDEQNVLQSFLMTKLGNAVK